VIQTKPVECLVIAETVRVGTGPSFSGRATCQDLTACDSADDSSMPRADRQHHLDQMDGRRNCSWFVSAPLSRNGLVYLFPFGWATLLSLTKSFVLSAHSVEERMQNIRTDSSRVSVMSDDFAHSRSALDCMFVPIPTGTGPGSLP